MREENSLPCLVHDNAGMNLHAAQRWLCTSCSCGGMFDSAMVGDGRGACTLQQEGLWLALLLHAGDLSRRHERDVGAGFQFSSSR